MLCHRVQGSQEVCSDLDRSTGIAGAYGPGMYRTVVCIVLNLT